MSKVVYIETDTSNVYRNFAIEYYIAAESNLLETLGCDVIFLFWRTTPTLMVGKYQNVYKEINLSYAKEQNINIVRRLSGGGTIYTDEGGWQFTFITDKNTETISFGEFIAPVISALASIGITAKLSGRNDILVNGKKVSGNAQYKLGGKTVHHGSLLFSTNIEQMVASTTVADYKIISKGIRSVRERVTNINEHLQKQIAPEQFKQLMVSHILQNGTKYVLTDAQNERIEVLAKEKFESWDAIFGAEPKFSIAKNAHLAGGNVELHFDVKKGIVTDCAIYGDFFATVDALQIVHAVRGSRFEKQAIAQSLINAGLERAFFNISVDEIADIMTN